MGNAISLLLKTDGNIIPIRFFHSFHHMTIQSEWFVRFCVLIHKVKGSFAEPHPNHYLDDLDLDLGIHRVRAHFTYKSCPSPAFGPTVSLKGSRVIPTEIYLNAN